MSVPAKTQKSATPAPNRKSVMAALTSIIALLGSWLAVYRTYAYNVEATYMHHLCMRTMPTSAKHTAIVSCIPLNDHALHECDKLVVAHRVNGKFLFAAYQV